MEWDWEAVVSNYESLKKYPNKLDFANGMLSLIKELRLETEFIRLRPHITHHMLILSLSDTPNSLPTGDGFATAISIYWIETNHYRISIGFHESLVVPAEEALAVAKYQLARLRDLIVNLQFSDTELQTWKEYYYHSRTHESIFFRYSRLPRDWILMNLHLDISNYKPRLRSTVFRLQDQVKKDTINVRDLAEIADETIAFGSYLDTPLEVSLDVDEQLRSRAFLKTFSDQQ